jgi:beta-mannanase
MLEITLKKLTLTETMVVPNQLLAMESLSFKPMVIRKSLALKYFLLILLMVLTTLAFLTYKAIPKRTILFGAWTEGFFDPKTKELHPEKLVQFEKLVNKKTSIAHYYIGWESLNDPQLISQFDKIHQYGWTPMLNVNPYYFSQCPATNLPLYQAIAEGKCDEFLESAGKNLSQVNKPFYLLFAWEMNNDQNKWSVISTGSTSADFVQAWRHMHDVFSKAGASHVIWVFTPNIPDVTQTPYSALYPGDNYVDWVGLDGYNWGTTQSWSQWLSFSEIFKAPYHSLTTIAPSKPVMLAEINSTDQGGDKAAWFKDMLTKQIPTNFPQIQAVVIFNEDRSDQENVNWKIQSTSNSLKGFTQAINSGYYN